MEGIALKPHSDDEIIPRRTEMDAYKFSSFCTKPPEIGFGTGTRPPLCNPTGGPGPGSYPLKTTMGRQLISNLRTPSQFTIKGRTKFGDPNEKTMNPAAKDEPGPAAYDLTGKFLAGKDPRRIIFPKAKPFQEKAALSPGPGSYEPMVSMGKQVLSTKVQNLSVPFGKAERGGLDHLSIARLAQHMMPNRSDQLMIFMLQQFLIYNLSSILLLLLTRTH